MADDLRPRPTPPAAPAGPNPGGDGITATPVPRRDQVTADRAPAPGPLKGALHRLWHTPESAAKQADGTREVIETVVFVVVLVLLLKSFVVEAFVIPTGSMATTLYGYQKDVTCPACGYDYVVNCSEEVEPQNGRTNPVVSGVCENCRFLAHFRSEQYPDAKLDPSCGSGDRVLVAKFLYDSPLASDEEIGSQVMNVLAVVVTAVVGFAASGMVLRGLWRRRKGSAGGGLVPLRAAVGVVLAALVGWCVFGSGPAYALGEPERHDVVVFKYPRGPQKNYTPMNYIKRLIGRPGETIAVHAGKLFYLPADKSPPYAGPLPERPEDLWRSEYMNAGSGPEPRDPRVAALWRRGEFQIIRKSPEKILALRRLVYDNDHPPKDLDRPEYQRWKAEGGWEPAGARGFRATAAGSGGTAWLRYRHLIPKPANRTDVAPELITDFLSYNTGNAEPKGLEALEQNANWVGDLILECDVTVDEPSGELVLELAKGPEFFRARWDLASGMCTLSRVTKGGPEGRVEAEDKLGDPAPTALKGKGTHRLRFANVDDRLTVWVDGRLPFDEGRPYQPKGRAPTRNDLWPASIGVTGGGVQVAGLKLWRDTYYTAKLGQDISKADVSVKDWRMPEPTEKEKENGIRGPWEAFSDLPVCTLYVHPGHYLCLGDNSTHSSDSRDWGLVPQRLMLGRALLIYYPFGRMGRIR